ncbi:MAG: peptide ABC transporter substrate-binding protein [Bacillota bacterium]
MKRFLVGLLVVALSIGVAACSGGTKTPPATPRASADYVTVYSSEVTTFNYLTTATTAEFAIAANCIDGLVEYDNLGILKPSLATSWTVSPDGLTYTFNLRKGVKWLTWDKKEYAEVVAQDWVDALKYIMTSENASSTANLAYDIIKNGAKFYNKEITDFAQVGVKAKDKYTLEITLEKPCPYFMTMLTYVTYLPVNGKFLSEVGDKFGTDHKNLLYCGAYIITDWEHSVARVMEKNEKYWDAGNVHIKKLSYKFNKEASTLAPEMFLRGEISSAGISSALLADWMADPAKKAMIRPGAASTYSYFYAFNFDPLFDEEYEPDNWKVAVNNANFRKSMFYALDRKAAMTTAEPYTPESRIINTVTPPNFANAGGKDFTQIGDLAAISARDSFQPTEAVKYRDLAKAELAGKAKFPVKVMMPYNTASTDWTNRVQVVEQQVEGVLGSDYVDIIPVGFPATGFLNTTRRAGNYAWQECNWGPDYADPETYTDPFAPDGTYNWPEKAEGYVDANGKKIYENLLNAAKAEVTDINKRYELFAKAEAFLINEAFIVPYGTGGGGYVASKLEPFTYPYAPFGMSDLKFKGQIVMEKPMGTEEYMQKKAEWEAARKAALEAAAK